MMPKAVHKIGLTARVVDAEGYSEPRDALAQDWYEFLRFALPEVSWILIPNLGLYVLDYVQQHKLDAFIFTGGNNIGSAPLRDETERVLLTYALTENIPVFGVCRGLQLIQSYFDGKIKPCSSEEHVAKEHTVIFSDGEVEEKVLVNSYHNFGVPEQALKENLKAFAKTLDGWVEGLSVDQYNIMSVMWHPERGRPFREMDKKLIRTCFGLEG